MVPGAGFLITGAISGSTAASLTFTMAKIYISALKEVSQREYQGETIMPEEIKRLVEAEIKKYMTGKKS